MNNVITILFLFFSVSLLGQSLSERLKDHVSYLSDTLTDGRGLGTEGKTLSEVYIERQFQEVGLTPWQGSYKHDFRFRTGLVWVNASNYIGVIEGSDPSLKDEYIVVGAHYDHLGYKLVSGKKVFYPGADDNASGVASIIEMARMLQQNKNQLKRSIIIVAFDAEESGLLGAKHFVDEETVPLKDIKAMFSLDMVGMYSSYKGIDLTGIKTIKDIHIILDPIVQKHKIDINKKSDNIEQQTDTAPFGTKGIPAIHVFTGLKSPYHKPEDVSHLLDYDGMAVINEFMVDLVIGMSQVNELNPKKGFTSKGSGAFGSVKLDIGILGALGSNNHAYLDRFYDAKSLLGYNGGLFMELHFSSLSSISTSVRYDINRSQHDAGSFSRQSLFIPLNYVISSPTKSTGFRAYASLGPYYRHNFSAKVGTSEYEVPEQVLDTEWGYNWELGFDIKRYKIGWNYHRALTDTFSKTEDLGRVRNRGSHFFVGIKF